METGINDLLGGFDITVHYDFLKNRYLENYPDSSEIEMVRREIDVHERDLDSFKEFFQYGEGVAFLDYDEVTDKIKSVFIASLEDLRKREKYISFFKEKLRILELEQKLEEKGINSTWEFNAKEKVFLLDQIGILTFLRDSGRKTKSPNSIAEVLAPLLNTNKSSLQKYINSYLSIDEIAEKPNEKSIEKIKKFLLEKGFSK